MTITDCKGCEKALPELLLEGRSSDGLAELHLRDCAACRIELEQLRATMELMDEWVAPEPSAYFDTRLYARLREDQQDAPQGLWDRVSASLGFKAHRGLRPALAGALGLAMILGGGTAATLLLHHGSTPVVASPTVDDLKIYDNNAQAVQQMDMLDDAGQGADDAPQT